MPRIPRALALGAACLTLAGCGGLTGGSATNSQPSQTIAVAPTSTTPKGPVINGPPGGTTGASTGATKPSKAPATGATSSQPGAAKPRPQPTGSGPPRPKIVWHPIPLTAKRKAETRAYSIRHYGRPIVFIPHPHVIVEHYTATPDFDSAFNTFANDVPDVELGELPQVCSQFIIDSDGTIYQLTPIRFMCRHTVGLNYTAIGIEHVGESDSDILDNPPQLHASIALTRWLRCRFGIKVKNVIGHSESLSSPYHHEDVPSLRTQTHSDWTTADMDVYRHKLAQAGGC